MALVGLSAQAADLHFGFDAGSQGWSAVAGGSATWLATGGNGGGFLEITDISSDDFLAAFPASAMGDWSEFLGGSIAFDARNINGDAADWGTFGLVTLSGAAGTLSLDLVPLGQPGPGASWQGYSVPLTVALWGANLPAVLASLNSVTIGGEFHNGVTEVVGFDNIAVTAVPEPATAALLLAGLGLLGMVARHRRS